MSSGKTFRLLWRSLTITLSLTACSTLQPTAQELAPPQPLPAWPEQGIGAPEPTDELLTPEQFGAKGDGRTDDLSSLQKLFVAANRTGQSITFRKGATYLISSNPGNGYQLNVNHANILIEGNEAVIRVENGTPTNRSFYALRIASPNVTVRNLTLDLNRQHRPAPSNQNHFGLFLDGGSENVHLKHVKAINSPVDNLYVRDQVSITPNENPNNYPRRIYIEQSEFLGARRHNATFISSRDVFVRLSRFNAANGLPYSCGIDIEPNTKLDRLGNDGLYFQDIETSDNRNAGINIGQSPNRNVLLKDVTAMRNGTEALFIYPSGQVTLDGLTAGESAPTTRGIVSLVPSDFPGQSVRLHRLYVTRVPTAVPAIFQNYQGRVMISDLKVNWVESALYLNKPAIVRGAQGTVRTKEIGSQQALALSSIGGINLSLNSP